MDILVLAAGIIVVVVSLIYAVYPLFGRVRRREVALSEVDPELSDLLSERDTVLQAIRDLDFDYRLGKLSDEDYKALRAQYTARGVAILQQLDAAAGLAGEPAPASEPGVESLDEVIEAEVRRLREHRAPTEPRPAAPPAADLEAKIEAEVRKLRARPKPAATPSPQPQPVAAEVSASQAVGRCPDCNEPYLPGDKFCARCGRALVRTCPSCGTTATPEDRFCSQCGTKL
jgi:hypothetical protein